MRIGIHTSSSPRLQSAALKAQELGANCFQIFSASPRMWRASPPPPEEVAETQRLRRELDLAPLVIHDSYLINLASAKDDVRAKSIAAFRGEVERAQLIGAEYLVMHPGSATGHPDLESALSLLAASLAELPRPRFRCLYATARKHRGRRLHHRPYLRGTPHASRSRRAPAPLRRRLLPRYLSPLRFRLRCRHREGTGAVVKQADAILGLDQVPVIHANDSKGAFDSRLDRHANIGEGHIGLEGFRRILNHPKLRAKAFILETPIDQPGDDRRNVDTLKSLCRNSRTTIKKSN